MLTPVSTASPSAPAAGDASLRDLDPDRSSSRRAARVPDRARFEAADTMSQSSGLGDRARQALLESASETGPDGLSADERQLVEQLRARDREVRNHEEAHARVGGQYAGAPSYDLQAGPDGRSYAIGGSVPIDVSPVRGDPEATIVKMEVVKAAALAPAKPSAADRNIAALADANRLEALAQLASQRRQSPEADADDARGPLVAAAEALTRMARLLSDGVDMIGRGVVDQAV